MNAAYLLVDRVNAMHEFLCCLGFLRLLNNTCFHLGVDLVARYKFKETPYRIQFDGIVIVLGLELNKFLGICFLEEILDSLVNDGPPLVFFEFVRVGHKIDIINK